jgi:hypothetical protein
VQSWKLSNILQTVIRRIGFYTDYNLNSNVRNILLLNLSLLSYTTESARWPYGQYARRAIAELKQR